MASGDSSSSSRTPTAGRIDETFAQRRPVQVGTGLTTSSTTSSVGGGSSSSSSSQTRSARRSFYEFLMDLDNRLQLAVAQAKKATRDIEQWRKTHRNQKQVPGHMTWFHDHLDELQGTQLEHLQWDVRSARSSLEQLINDGVIRESTLLRPQPKKYTTACMRAEVKQLENKLSVLLTQLAAAQAAWKMAFAPWI